MGPSGTTCGVEDQTNGNLSMVERHFSMSGPARWRVAKELCECFLKLLREEVQLAVNVHLVEGTNCIRQEVKKLEISFSGRLHHDEIVLNTLLSAG